MKKIFCVILILSMLVSLVGCSSETQENSYVEYESSVSSNEEADVDTDVEIDVDLTLLSATMVYAEVFNMIVKPTEYDGLTVKMSGELGLYANDAVDYNIYVIIIADATECCAQGIEFIPLEESVNDFTQAGEDVTIIGTFETYEENSIIYYRVKDAYLA